MISGFFEILEEALHHGLADVRDVLSALGDVGPLGDALLGVPGEEDHLELEGLHDVVDLLLGGNNAAGEAFGVVAAFLVTVFER